MTARLLVLSGGAPWGFRMHGGVDCAQTLRITRVNPGSKAAASGVREGDIITSINGQSTRQLSNTEAHALLRNAGQSLRLGLNEELSASPSRRQFKTIHQETTHQEIIKRSSITTYSIKTEESSKFSNIDDTKNNEIKVNGTSKSVVPTSTVVTQRPTLESSSSTSSSSASTLKEDLRNTSTDNALASQRSSYTNCTVSPTNSVFSEDVSVSKSAKQMKREEKYSKNDKNRLDKSLEVDSIKVPPEVPVRKYKNISYPGNKTWMEISSQNICSVNGSKPNEHIVPINKESQQNTNKLEGQPDTDSKGGTSENNIPITLDNSILSSQNFKKSKETIIPITKNWFDSELSTERIVPITKESLASSSETLHNLTKFQTVSELSKNWGGSLNEIDIVKETQNLENSKNISIEKIIPVRTSWSSSQQELNVDDISLKGKSEVNKDCNTEEGIKKDIVIPIEKDWSKKEESLSIHIKKTWNETESDLKNDINKEYTIPITFDGSSSKDWVNKLNEINIVKEAQNLENSNNRGIEKSIRVNRGLSNSQQEINVKKQLPEDTSLKGKTEIDKDSIIGEGKEKEIIIPIEKEWTKKEESLVINTKKTWNDKECDLNSEKFKQNNTASLGNNNEYLNIKPKERFIPITKNLTELDNRITRIPEKKYPQFSNTPLYQQWSNSTSTKEESKTEKIEQIKPKEYLIPLHIETANEQPDLPHDRKSIEEPAIMPNISKEVIIPIRQDWIAMPTERNPNVLLCLSPKQKEALEKTKKIPNEAERLLDLHQKFMNRIAHEEVKNMQEEKVTITNVSVPIHNRLLGIIKEEPSMTTSTDDANYLYFIEQNPKASLSSCGPKNASDARLKAKDLSEWLNLARNKSKSESNLSTTPGIPENNLRDLFTPEPKKPQRRTSLPYDICERQMLYLQEKEREIQKQLEELEEEKRRIGADMAQAKEFKVEDYHFSRKGDFAETKTRPTSMPHMPTELFRQQMYQEYMDKFQAREERKQHKVIKVSSSSSSKNIKNQETDIPPGKEIVHPVHIEKEFMDKVKQKQMEGKLEKVKSLEKESSSEKEINDGSEPVLVMEGQNLKEAKKLPKHLREFVDITKQSLLEAQEQETGIWSPGQKQESRESPTKQQRQSQDYIKTPQDEAIQPIWTPKSASASPTVERKEFKPVNFPSPVLNRKTRTKSENFSSDSPAGPSWKTPDYSSDTGIASSSTTHFEKRLTTSHSSPASGFGNLLSSPRLPKAQNPTITLLQKAREGHLPRGPIYIEEQQKQFRPRDDRPPIANPGEVLYKIKNEYTSESDSERPPRKMADLGPRKFEGIGPVSKDGMPLILRSEVKDQNQSKWYKRMYDTIHKQKPHSDEYVTVRYKQKRAQYPYTSGYLSEPEPGAYDSDFTDYKYQTLDRRRTDNEERYSDYVVSSTMPRNTTIRSSSSDLLRTSQNQHRTQPGRIENYTPGHSSIAQKEAKEWWDEVMDIFDGHLEQQKRYPPQKSFINQALKESGYESDSTLVFRRREEAAQQQLSPKEQREAYKQIQKGGDVPLHGLRKPAPERPKEPEPPLPPPKGQHARNMEQESPRKYIENEVTIHYKTPVRHEIKDYISEDELAYRQAENMKKIYQEERRKKYLQVSKSLQELQDINSRRHTDNFIPSQKSPISLSRYDDFEDLAPTVKPRPRSPEPRLVAKALYNFVGQTARELTFRKGDLIYVRRQVDKNWYEGELNAMVGLFPTNYVEIVPYDGIKTTPRKSHEGQARAKYNFLAQTHLELSLAKGELVVITRKVDDNWFEGKIGGRKGIFPASYVEVLIDPHDPLPSSGKPVAAPAAHSLLLNGSAGGKESMGSHCYTPSSSFQANRLSGTTISSSNNTNLTNKNRPNVDEALHIETQSEPVPYRALYKYLPQNEDELELLEGDTVYVLEKCDDGWYVGSSNRTGAFGTFPGNYVEKI